jgi:hypothetical protein
MLCWPRINILLQCWPLIGIPLTSGCGHPESLFQSLLLHLFFEVSAQFSIRNSILWVHCDQESYVKAYKGNYILWSVVMKCRVYLCLWFVSSDCLSLGSRAVSLEKGKVSVWSFEGCRFSGSSIMQSDAFSCGQCTRRHCTKTVLKVC